MIYGPLWISNPRRVDSQNRSAPTTDFLVRPDLPHLIRGPMRNLLVYSRSIGQDALQHDQTARVTVECRVVPPGSVEAIVNGVQSVDLGRFREISRDVSPVSGDGLAQFFFPFAGYIEAIAPVGNLVGEIEALFRWGVLCDSKGPD